MRRIVVVIVVVAALAAGGFGVYRWFGQSSALAAAPAQVVPTARVTRGPMKLTVYLQGELRAAKQIMLTAPPAGAGLRILRLAETGTLIAKDEPIIEFDPADQQYELEKAESELLEAEQELIKRRAEIKAQEAGDKVALMSADFDVRRAKLDATVDQDLISANDYRIRQAELQEAQRNFDRLKRDVTSRAQTNQASLAVLEEKKNRSTMAATRARQNMDNLVLKAPADGVVSVRENMSGMMFYYEGMSVQSYHAGDTVSSGRPLIDIFDLSSMEVRARVNEQERANIAPGQTARIEADSVPGLTPTAKVTAVAGMGRPDSRSGPLRQFDVTLELANPDPRLRPGTTVRVLVDGGTVDNMLIVPRQGLFEIDGKSIVYVRAAAGDGFAPKPVKVLHRTETQIAIEGLGEGVEVALVDPVAAMKLNGASTTSSGATGSSPAGPKK
jgi:HlyD family secretion protein